MLTSIALIISGITSCICIVIAISERSSAKYWENYYYQMRDARDRLMEKHGSTSIQLMHAEKTLKKVRELVIIDDPKSDGEA